MTVARVVTGRAGQVQMRMELTPRFGYGLDQPRLKRAGADLLAVCGPDTLRLSTPIELDVRDGPGEGAPPWPVSWKLRPARLRYSLAAFQVELVSLGIGHYDPSSWCGLSAVLDDLGAKRHDAGELLSLGPSGKRSRWTRFFTVLDSGTLTNTSRGPVPSGSPTSQKGLPGISCFEQGHRVTPAQNCATDAASTQSNVTFRIELLIASSTFRAIAHPSPPGAPTGASPG